MTRRAGARYAGVIKPNLGPAARRMAIIAGRRGTYVTWRLARSNPAIVTSAAEARRSIEHAVQMAAFTVDGPVLSLKRKTGVDMVRDLFRGRRSARRCREKHEKRAGEQRAGP